MQKLGVILFEYNFFSLQFFHSWPSKKKARILFFFVNFFPRQNCGGFFFCISWVSFYYLQAIVPIPNPNPDGPKFFP